MEGLEDELTCPVCLELYTCPLLLPCHHNLCRRCAEAFLEAPAGEPEGAQAACSSEPAPPSPEDTPGSFACPTCREDVHLGDRGVDGLGRNQMLQNIIDRFKQIHAQSQLKRSAVACLVCDATPPRDAVKSCTTCKLSYCRVCLELLHPSRGGLSNHQLVPPVESFDDLQKTVMCPDHKNKPVELYCKLDKAPVCCLCKLVGKHKEHDVAALDEVFEGKKKNLQKVIDKVAEKVQQETRKIRGLEVKKAAMESHAAQLRSQIDTECEAMISIIRERKIVVLKRVESVAQSDTARIQTTIDSCEEVVKTAKSSLAFAKEAIKESDPACFLQSEQVVKGRVEESSSAFAQDGGYEHIPTDRLSIDMSSVKSLLQNIDLPCQPAVLEKECSTTKESARVTWKSDDRKSDDRNVSFNVLLDGTNVAAVKKHSTCNITGLQKNTNYELTVVAQNNIGKSKGDSITLKTKKGRSKSKIVDLFEDDDVPGLEDIVPDEDMDML